MNAEALAQLIIMYQEYFKDDFLGCAWDAERQEYRFRFMAVVDKGWKTITHYYNNKELEEAVCAR